MHFKHISAKIQSKNLTQHFDFFGALSWAFPLVTPLVFKNFFVYSLVTIGNSSSSAILSTSGPEEV